MFRTIPVDKNATYGEGQEIITTNGIGHSKEQVSASFRGSVFYKSSSTNRKLSFLNNKIEFLKLK